MSGIRRRALLRSAPLLSRALFISYAAAGVNQLASVVLSTVLPFHVTALGGSSVEVGLLFSVMTVASMLARPVAGSWADRHGVGTVLLPGAVVIGVASVAMQLAWTPLAVAVVMVGVGVGGALVSTGATVLNTRASPPERRGEALSLYYLATSLSVAVGPPMALGLWWLGGIRATLVAVTAMAAGLVGLTLSRAVATGSARTAALPGFRMASHHALPIAMTLILTVLGNSSIYAFLPLYAVSAGRGRAVPLFFAGYALCLIAGRVFLRRLPDRVGRERTVRGAIALTALGFLGLALPPTPASLLVAGIVLGSGSSLLYPSLAALVVERTPESERGLALGTLSAAWDLAVVLGSTLIGLVADVASYAAGFAVGGSSAGLGLLAFALQERRRARGVAFPRPAAGV